MSCSACPIALTAAPSDDPGARLNDTVVAGNWLRCVTSNGAGLSMNLAIAESGTCPPDEVEEGR